ncbi:MAG TPA: hypothetical protein VIU11_00510 [Nakamurella sp.]
MLLPTLPPGVRAEFRKVVEAPQGSVLYRFVLYRFVLYRFVLYRRYRSDDYDLHDP